LASDLPAGLTAQNVIDQLAWIQSSSAFASSARHRKFLGFVVEETLAGRASRIKAYTIATAAFGRSDDFDPQQDSIVRIEAGRLRRALEHYYLTAGAADRVRIVIPKGTYVPRFELFERGSKAPPVAPPPREKLPSCRAGRGPRIFVSHLEQEGPDANFDSFSAGFARQLIMGLTRFDSVQVFGMIVGDGVPTQPDLHQLAAEHDVDYVLSGTVTFEVSGLTVDLLLQELPSGRFVWTERFQRDLIPAELIHLRNEIANQVVQRLAQPYGILHSRALDSEGETALHLGSYPAVLDYYDFIRSFDRARFTDVRRGLERAVAQDPAYAEGLASLSMHYINAVRFKFVDEAEVPGLREAAMGLAQRAVQHAPNSSSAFHALALAQWFARQVELSLSSYRTAMRLNPNDAELAADLSMRLAMRMQWEPAMHLYHDAVRRDPFLFVTCRVAAFLNHYAAGRHAEALEEARRAHAPEVIYTHIMRAAAAAELGLQDEAGAAVAELERVYPNYGRHIEEDLRARNLHEDLITMLGQSLRKAGLCGAGFSTRPKPQAREGR
jgi:TolB-like protein